MVGSEATRSNSQGNITLPFPNLIAGAAPRQATASAKTAEAKSPTTACWTETIRRMTTSPQASQALSRRSRNTRPRSYPAMAAGFVAHGHKADRLVSGGSPAAARSTITPSGSRTVRSGTDPGERLPATPDTGHPIAGIAVARFARYAPR